MKTFIYELGVISKIGKTHPVQFRQGLNIVTGKSSTGKSALIEIFDYCFGSGEYTVPKGVITDNAALYYVYLNVNGQDIVLGRLPDGDKKAFFKREEGYFPENIILEYFTAAYFRPLADYKKHVSSLFLDIDDVDDSLAAKENRHGKKAPTPSIRSFVSFMLQHQNLVANKHALFYRFDEKEKRDQTIEHTKIFLNLVDQKFFHLSQEKERLKGEEARIKREQELVKKLAENQKKKIDPVLHQLYAAMGLSDHPISLDEILRHPQDAKDRLEKIIRPENIIPLSDALTQQHLKLQQELAIRTSKLRQLQRQVGSLNRHLSEEEKFVNNSVNLQSGETFTIAKLVCPFCNTEHEHLQQSAEQLQEAIYRLSNNLKQAKPMRAKFESSLIDVYRQIEELSKEVKEIRDQIRSIEKSEKILAENKNLYESVLLSKVKLDMMLESLDIADDSDLTERKNQINDSLQEIERELKKYSYKDGLSKANDTVNSIMGEIGQNFEFEDSYKPINLHFSFETFELYHLNSGGEKIFLRSMGSGANWLYSHITLFLALHKYFASLGEKCAIPSILFLDQPTQVYFPSFKFDKSERFDKEAIKLMEQRSIDGRQIDEDIKAVENLFSQLSIYCTITEKEIGFTPQIIVTDHADDLTLSDGTNFDTFVNGNRWRTRGLIFPVLNNNT